MAWITAHAAARNGITGTPCGDELGVQEYAPGGDMYSVLAAAGGFLHEEQAAGGVLLPLLRALAALHGQARPPCRAVCMWPLSGHALTANPAPVVLPLRRTYAALVLWGG